MTNRINKQLFSTLLLTGVVGTSMAAGVAEDFTKSVSSDTKMNLMLPENDSVETNTFDFLTKYVNKDEGLTEDKLKVSGVMRFLTIHRYMQEHYLDMINSENNFSFSDYPLANVANNSNGGYPMLELNLQSKLAKNFDFNVGYSLAHSFTGIVDEDEGGTSKLLSVRQNLNFKASHRAGMIKSTAYAGEILWTNLSRFTMGQPEYRDNYFERLPWDWYRKSFTRYQEYYSLSNNIGAEALGRSPLQGFIALVEWLPMQLSFKAIYGRTNRSLVLSKSNSPFPSYTHGYRLEKVIFERQVRGRAGLNLYQKNAESDFTGGEKDINTIGSLDWALKVVNKVNISGEIGYSKLQNPYFEDSLVQASGDNGSGLGAVVKVEFDRRAVLWPFSVEYYNIDKNLVSLDGGIINSNPYVRDGGYATEFIYDNMNFGNISGEASQMANNRSGVNLRLEATIGKLKAQFGYSISQETTNLTDTITMQHRVNSFSRSRFRPWFQAGGPYARIKSFWLRTFETITIGNEFYDPAGRGLLGFNTVELFLKYRLPIGKKHELVLLNFNSLNSVKENFNFFGNIDDNTYTTLIYEDFTAAFKVTEKLSFVGNYGIEHFRGSTRTNLSPEIATTFDDAGNPTNLNDRIISQIGQVYALGVDYDINKTTSVHLRHKYMTHEDKNFTKDRFSGFETNFELKIFF